MSRFNHGFVPDQPDGYRSNGSGYASNNNARVPPTGGDMVYTTGNDPRGYSRNRPNYEGNGVATAFGGTKPVGNNGVATGHVGSRESHASNTPNKKDSYYARNKRCMLAVILVIVALIVLAVVAILVLFFLGFFESSPPLNVEYDGEVRFNVTWTSDLEDKMSEAYKNTSDHFMSLMTQVLDNTTHYGKYEVDLTDTLPGSIRCMFTMMLSSVDESIEATVDGGLKKLFDAGITSWYTEYTSVTLASSTEPPTTQEPTTLIFTTPGRITPPPAPTCKPIPEPLCMAFDYDKTGTVNSPRFSALYPSVQRECYTHALLYACTSSFPVCAGSLERYPCRQFCYEFMMNCSFPVNCAGYQDDDVDTLCYMSPESLPTEETVTRNPAPDPCQSGEFMCGDGHCIPDAQKCDNVDQCGDHSDETNCPGLTSTLDCDFEMNDICDYSNHDSGHFSWSLQIGATPSLNTGPLTDHTLRTSLGHYLYAEASGQYSYSRAGLLSPEVTLETEWCLRFYYHMLGEQVDGIKISQYAVDDKEQLLWQRSRDHGDIWRFGSVTLPAGAYRILWEVTRGEGFLSDVAVDDITAREGACPAATSGCANDEFHCANDNCVTFAYVCDSFNDCGDLSDEKPCNCTEEEYQCGFGMCIPAYGRCDGFDDCPDGTDEQNCEDVCSNGRHKCTDGTCIMNEWVCDHEADCPDGSDEVGCPACTDGQFQCRDHGCVNDTDICDGTRQCADGSDEFQCFQTRDDHMVEVYSGEVWKGLCAEDLPIGTANHVCQLMGYMTSLRHSVITVTGGSYVKFVASGDPGDNFLAQLSDVDSCLSNQVYAVECVVPECGKQTVDHHAESQIVNGQDALPGQWPWQIGLYYNGFFSCGGSLVSHHHVITAAHCLKVSKDPGRYQVILGATFREPSPDNNRVEVDVAAIQAHPGYTDAVWGDDIAVLTLDRYISFNNYIKPICLPNDLDYFPTSAQCYTSGWGRTDYYNTTSVPLRLQEAKMKLWSDKKCGQAHISFKDSMTCAGYESGYISNCPGDSGGPLQCKDPHGYWKLYGAFSFFVRGCNVPLQPPVFTKVQSYLPWVLDNLDCVFICDNQRCIWDEDLVCNGVDDCGDMSDEIDECSPSMTCSFDTDSYQCGYSYTDDISKSSWAQLTNSGTPNEGPVTDISLGNSSGYFMYGGRDRSVLVSPIQDRATPSCVQFAYHLRGASAGSLQITTAQVPANIHHPSQVDLSVLDHKYSEGGNKLDIWNSKRIDLAAGRFVVVFTGIANSQQGLPLAAIDDVRVFDGSCQSITCASGEVSCNDRCVPQTDVCNYHTLCLAGDDEADCNAPMTYSCDMETYGHCRLEQTLPGRDRVSRDWTLLETEDFGNGPPGDHTTGEYGGHVLYLSTLVGIPGQFAVVQLSIKIPAGDHCLQFFYSMVSTGALRVYLCDNALNCEIKWSDQNVNTPGWEAVQMSLTEADNLVQIFGYTGSFSSGQDMGYISIDDISIQDGACAAPSCLWNEFTCSDGTCIRRDQICDTNDDCTDGGDESVQTCDCMPDMFQCGDGTCILGIFRCDGYQDCADNSDESTCNTCGEEEFVCTDDATCRNRFVFCDGAIDCADESDEPIGCMCLADQFECATFQGAAPGFCIPGIRYCDGVLDCSDGSDEPVAGCDSCDTRWHFNCGDGSCVPKEFVCDGVSQCSNGEDENPVNCVFACNDASTISMVQYCDGVPDCSVAEDEPANCDCPFGYTACVGGGCVLATALCDGVYNCKDHSDELTCVCGANMEQCTSGMCIPSTAKCDSFVDCDDWSDELQCAAQCSAGEFTCDNGVCLPNTLRCDGSDNCGDGSDEVGCVCDEGEMSCPVERKCISLLWQCDGVDDCSDGLDENSCATCAANQFQCTSDKACIAQSRRCDNTEDCTDGSDEANCERNDANGFLESFKGDRWSTVCSTDWQNNWNNEVCRQMGKGLSISSTFEASTAAEFLVVAEGTAANSDFNTGLLALGTCTGAKGIKITCGDLACGVSDPQIQPLIIGGSAVSDENKWPWMASLLYLGGPRCGATLINSQWLVTAAHCFSGPSLNDPVLQLVPGYFTVTLGTTKQAYMGSPDHQDVTSSVTTIIPHPDYTVDNSKQGMLFNDIALVKLGSPVGVSTSVRPLCFPKQDQVFNTKRECYSAGWGFVDTQSTEADFAPILDLRDGRLRMWTFEECSEDVAWGSNVNSTVHVCAGLSSGAVATCNGDSGGPLMCRDLSGRWDLVGVTSAGSNCGQGTPPNRPGVFTRVALYIDWINQQIAANR